MMKQVYPVLFIFLLITVITGQTNISGTIASNDTLNLSGSPYIVTGTVTINAGVTVMVDSAVQVRFQSGTSMLVYGSLNARHALFTSTNDTSGGSPTAGDWSYIQVGYSISGTLVMDTCRVRYGGGNSSYPTNIYVYNGTAELTGCDISNSSNQGLRLYIGTTRLTNTNIFSCNWPIIYVGAAELEFNGLNNLAANTHAGIHVYANSTSNAFVLDTIDVPYYFSRNFTVNNSGTLEIASSNILKFGSSVSLTVNGKLKANASMGENIHFTAYTNDNIGGDTNADGASTIPGSRYWDGVQFNDASIDSACIVRRGIFSFAGNGSIGAVTMYNAGTTIDNCSFDNNYYGVMMNNVSTPVFSNNTIGSSEVVPIALSFDADPQFSNNTFSFSDNTYDAIGLIGGTLQASAELPQRDVTGIPNVTYLMLGTVTVPAEMELKIHRGVVVKSYSNYYILVQGRLEADGTSDADSMITFTSVHDDTYGNPNDTNKNGNATAPSAGNWGGIVFDTGSDDSSILNYCNIHYAQLSSLSRGGRNISGGSVTTVNSSPQIHNNNISHTTYGIYAYLSSNPEIWNNHIENTSSTPVALSISADPDFSGNTFLNTGRTALGLIGNELGTNGTVKRRDVADYTNITYVLLENLIINSGTYVTIEAGVVIKLYNIYIYIDGGLSAQGDQENGAIVFTSLRDDNYGNPGDTNGDGAGTSPAAGNWYTIQFRSTADDAYNILNNCLIKYAGYSSNGLVSFTNAGGVVSNCDLSDSYAYGIRCDGDSDPTIDGVEIINCNDDPIAMSLVSDPTFTNITFTNTFSSGIQILEGTLSANATLAKRNIAGINNIAYILGSVTIGSSATLTIQPGVVMKFPGTTNGITVNGILIAEGTPGEKIVFTSLEDDSNGGDTNNDGNATEPAWGDWWSIGFNSNSADTLNSMKYCDLRYGGDDVSGYGSTLRDYGMIRITDANVTIDSCVLGRAYTTGFGIYGSASPIITNCAINNVRLTPVAMSIFAEPEFSGNTISNIGRYALGIVPENYAQTAEIPKRNFAGYDNITYYLFRMNTINSGTTITIPEGVVFKYTNSYTAFDVEGALVSAGTQSNPVIFTNEYDDTFGNPADTDGEGAANSPPTNYSYTAIVFDNTSNDSISVVKNTIMRYRNQGIYLDQASPRITNCLIDRTNWGVTLNGVSEPAVDSTVFNDLTYTPLYISLVSYPRSTVDNIISGSTYRAIGVIGETLVQNVTLPKRNFAGITNIPYYFHNYYTIGTSVVLTLNPGLVLKFPRYSYLNIHNGLIAEGGASADSTIVFTDIRDDSYGGDTNADSINTTPNYNDGWRGIRFAEDAIDASCRLSYCIISYAGDNTNDGAIVTTNASPTIYYSVLTKNRYGLYATGASNPVINNCDIYNNITMGINNVNQSFNIDAQWNWWGTNTGPTHAGNPGGTGDVVTDMVNYANFLTSGALNPLMGDVSLNGIIQAFDGSMTLLGVVNPDTLNERQMRVADVSGENGVTAFDASLILQKVVGLIPAFPAEINSKKEKQDPARNLLALYKVSEAALQLGNASAKHGESVSLPVNLTAAKGIAAIQLSLSYDPELLSVRSVAATKVIEHMNLVYYDDKESGKLRIALAGTEKLGSIANDIAKITFDVVESVAGDKLTQISVDQFMANEQLFTKLAASGSIQITGIPLTFDLFQNYPNPFNSTTTIKYQVPNKDAHVTIEIYNLLGQLVKTLVDKPHDAGIYHVSWNGTNTIHASVASGFYIYRMRSGDFIKTKKFLLLK
jgi:hypothetical protein